MKHLVMRWLLAALVWAPSLAWANYQCSAVISGTPVATGSLTSGWTLKITLALVCTRLSSEPAHPSPTRNRPTMQIDLYSSAGSTATLTNGAQSANYVITVGTLGVDTSAPEASCSSAGAPTSLSIPLVLYSQNSNGNTTPALTFANNFATTTATRYLKVCLAAPAYSGLSAGTYSQPLTIRGLVLGINNNVILTTNYTVSTTVTTSCSFTLLPSTISLTYPSFSGDPVVASTSASITCSTGTPWSAAVSPTTGTLRGIGYGLTLNDGVNPTLAGTGNGTVQTLLINAKALKGQAGSLAPCAAPCRNTHTLTLSY